MVLKKIAKKDSNVYIPHLAHSGWKFEAKPHCNDFLAMPFEMVFEMNQSLALVEQLARIGHMWGIIIGHSTLPTIHLLMYNKLMIHEND